MILHQSLGFTRECNQRCDIAEKGLSKMSGLRCLKIKG